MSYIGVDIYYSWSRHSTRRLSASHTDIYLMPAKSTSPVFCFFTVSPDHKVLDSDKQNSQLRVHYNDRIMSAMASQITSLVIVYSSVYSGADQRKHQSSSWLAFVRGIHRSPVNSLHKGPVTRKMFPFDDVIMAICSIKYAPVLLLFLVIWPSVPVGLRYALINILCVCSTDMGQIVQLS